MGLAFLFYWISLESLFLLGPRDDIRSPISTLLGFPSGKLAKTFPKNLVKQLASIGQYEDCKRWLKRLLHEAQEFRNHIVHNGFRHADLDRKKLRAMIRVLRFASSFGREVFSMAIVRGSHTLNEVSSSLSTAIVPHILNTAKRFVDEVFLTAVGIRADYWPDDFG
jgi:hypothetical protein